MKKLPAKTSSKKTETPMTRRAFLGTTGKGLTLATLASGLPLGWVGAVYASDAPEVDEMKIGIIALTDCSPFVVAHEKGFFKKYGIKSTIAKQASWAAIRDGLSGGTIQATHMLIGMPFASTMGLLGSPRKPMVCPWLVNRNGQGITLSNKYKGKVKDDPKALKPFVDEAKGKGSPLTFAMTFPPGTHAMWMRYYLGAGNIHPDKDVALITIPPPQMVQNMKIGKMDGYCVGEPWNLRAIEEGIGYTAIPTQKIWKNHPEKVCAFLEEFAEKHPKTVKAFLKALHDAGVWLDSMDNRSEACDIVSQPNYINCPKEIILERMLGIYKYGDGRQEKDPDYMIFSDRNCNYPQTKYGVWWLSQFRRWGMVEGAPDYAGLPTKVLRPDIYEAAMKEINYTHGGANNSPDTLFDGVTFNPAEPEAYAKGFAVNSLKG
ncbi:MAG: CmpA/NrtA family ABC transporter substrate-binding protein [Methylacidiphilales bacterium]|nr:CmpA/NrtA family ABC transporter substrate-binding protein [Candidatus Methylacidiphilales bacterium]